MQHRNKKTCVSMSLCVTMLACGFGCEQGTKQRPTPQTTPSTTPETEPADADTPHTTPDPKPDEHVEVAETQPAATRPASTYESRPPYPVHLFVADPKEKQPGWLKVAELEEKGQLAEVVGQFPKRNVIEIETNNTRQLLVHIGQLPLAAKKAIVLRIDDQGIQVFPRGRDYIGLRRSPAGLWSVCTPDMEESEN